MAESASKDLHALKCIEMHITQKGQQIAKNGIKLHIIAKYQKLLNMVNKLQQMTEMKKKVKKCPKWAKTGEKGVKFKNNYFHRFSG